MACLRVSWNSDTLPNTWLSGGGGDLLIATPSRLTVQMQLYLKKVFIDSKKMNDLYWRNTQVIVLLLLCDSSRSSCLFSVSTNAVNLENLTHKCLFCFRKNNCWMPFETFQLFFKPCRVLEREEHRHFLGKSSITFSVLPWDSTFFYWACNRSALHLRREETLMACLWAEWAWRLA